MIKVPVRAGISCGGITGEGSISELMELLTEFSSSRTVGLLASVPRWLLEAALNSLPPQGDNFFFIKASMGHSQSRIC